jgi:hypothetical protein
MYIVIDLDNLKMVGAAKTDSHAEAIAEVDFSNVATLIANAHDGGSWTSLSQEQLATLYKNMSGQDAPEYGVALHQLREYVLTWPEYSTSEEGLRMNQADEMAEEAEDSVPTDDPVQQELAMRRAHQETIAIVEKANQQEGHKFNGQVGGSENKPAAAPTEPRKPGAVKRVWEISDNIMIEAKEKGLTDGKAIRKMIMNQCIAEGINMGTAGTQFGKWRTARGY